MCKPHVEQPALERCLVAAQQRVEQDLCCEYARTVTRSADDPSASGARVFGSGSHWDAAGEVAPIVQLDRTGSKRSEAGGFALFVNYALLVGNR